jgi:pilus assembly protein CpaF
METSKLDAFTGKILNRVLEVIDIRMFVGDVPPERTRELREVIGRTLEEALQDDPLSLTVVQKNEIKRAVEDDILWHGPLTPILKDEEVEDIQVNGPRDIYIVKRGQRARWEGAGFRDDAHVRQVLDRMVADAGKRLDESQPTVDTRLKDGSRLSAVIPPIALHGTSLSIRRFKGHVPTPQRMLEGGTFTQPMLEFLHGSVRARLNILVSGGTASGKTTLLNALSSFLGDTERVITIEDAPELRLQCKNIVRFQTRQANIQGEGEVNQTMLVKQSLRFNPDRIILGEVRGGEAFDMLQAMNTGHEGSMCTIHANSPKDSLHRLEHLVPLANLRLPENTLRSHIVSAIDLVVQIGLRSSEDGTPKRRVLSISEVAGLDENGEYQLNHIFVFKNGQFRFTGNNPTGRLLEKFHERGIEFRVPANAERRCA